MERVIAPTALIDGQRVEIRMPATALVKTPGPLVLATPTRAFLLDNGQTIPLSPTNLANIQVVNVEAPRLEHPTYRVGHHYLRQGFGRESLLFAKGQQFVNLDTGDVYHRTVWESWPPTSVTAIGRHGEAVDTEGHPFQPGIAYIEIDPDGDYGRTLLRSAEPNQPGWWTARGNWVADVDGDTDTDPMVRLRPPSRP